MQGRVVLLAVLMTGGFLPAQTDPHAPGSPPLTRTMEDVYKAVLLQERTNSPYDLIDLTGILRPDEGDYATCMKGFPIAAPSTKLHRLTKAFATKNHMGLISPEYAAQHRFTGYAGQIQTGSTPQEPAKIEACRIQLSEVVFDSRRQRAALNVTISCQGGGHSETHVYRRKHGTWKLLADCGSGIS
jgi:hypothetical protein